MSVLLTMTTALKDANLSGVIRYNGFRFGDDGSTPPTYRLEGTPVYDSTGRNVRFLRYRLVATTIVHADSESATSTLMADVRQRLSQPGKQLELSEIGLGDVMLPAGDDAIYAVRPRVVSLEPVGGMLAWQLVWQCEFHVNEQGATSESQAGDFNVLNFTTTYDIDAHGLTRRTIEGFVQIVQFGPTGERRTADRVRDRLRVAVPAGFRRASSRWTESADQAQLDFHVVDEELPGNALPAGITDGEVELELGASLAGGASTAATLRGHYRPAGGHFRTALSRMLLTAQSTSRRLSIAAGGKLVVPVAARVRQRVHRPRIDFQIEYKVMQTLADLLTTAGPWEPAGGDDNSWRTSMCRLWNNRGSAGLSTAADEDLVLDFSTSRADSASLGRGGKRQIDDDSSRNLPTLMPVINPRQSWLEYRLRIKHLQSDSAVESHQLLVEGTAIRLKFQPAAPRIKRLGGRSITEVSRLEEIEEEATWLGVTMYRMRFAVLYEVSGTLDTIEPPPLDDLARISWS